MNKFNRNFNNVSARMAFWLELTQKLAGFDNLVRKHDFLTDDDLRALKIIHEKIFECFSASKNRIQAHSDKLKTLRKGNKS